MTRVLSFRAKHLSLGNWDTSRLSPGFVPQSKINAMLNVGSQGVYEWLVTDEKFDLLQLCPEIVLAKYVAVTSIDSSQLVPTEQETAAGWQSNGKIAYSPKIQTIEELPRAGGMNGYIFNHATDLGTIHLAENIFEVPQEQGYVSVFVNYGFALHPPERSGLLEPILGPTGKDSSRVLHRG